MLRRQLRSPTDSLDAGLLNTAAPADTVHFVKTAHIFYRLSISHASIEACLYLDGSKRPARPGKKKDIEVNISPWVLLTSVRANVNCYRAPPAAGRDATADPPLGKKYLNGYGTFGTLLSDPTLASCLEDFPVYKKVYPCGCCINGPNLPPSGRWPVDPNCDC